MVTGAELGALRSLISAALKVPGFVVRQVENLNVWYHSPEQRERRAEAQKRLDRAVQENANIARRYPLLNRRLEKLRRQREE